MQRWPNIFVISILICSCVSPRIFATDKPATPEESGCGLDEITDSYFCNSGPLAGREFLTKAELEEALQTIKSKAKDQETQRATEVLAPAPAPSSNEQVKEKDQTGQLSKEEKPSSDNLKVMSWNMKALGGEDSDYDRAALVLSQADVVALQEVDLHGQGKGFINVLANLIQAKSQLKVCRAWVQAGNGERLTYGYLWKENTVGHVDSGGTINETCGETAGTIRQAKKMKLASQATFYFKPQKKMFNLATVFVDQKSKIPDKTVNELFNSLNESKWPVILAGDLKMGAGNAAFNGARKLGFHSAMGGKAKAWDNIWYRGAILGDAGPVNLYDKFSDARHEDIQKGFSGIFPVMGEFSLREEASTDSVSLISKAKSPVKKKAKAPKAK